MLFTAPPLAPIDRRVIEGIEAYRDELSTFLRAPRRWRGQLRRNLRARAMRGSNSIEGYDVSLDDAIALLDDDQEALDADRLTALEVTGYRNALTYVQQLATDPHARLDQSLVRGLHFMMLGHDLAKSPGSYRTSTVYVHDDERAEVVYEGPDPDDVPDLMGELMTQLAAQDAAPDEQPIFVSAAMAHLNLVMIHPFRDGNGRMARCLQTLILARHQVLEQDFASVEEWLGRNTPAYYEVLAATGGGGWNPRNDATAWVRFNLRAHHMQAQTVRHRVQESEELWLHLDELVAASRLPSRATSALFDAAVGLRVRRSAYQHETGLEYGAANRDLKMLVSEGLLEARGQTRARHYTGSRRVRDLYRDIRTRHRSRLVDPYESVRDLPPPDLDLEPKDDHLF